MKLNIYQYSIIVLLALLFMLDQQEALAQVRIVVHPWTVQSYKKVDNDSDNREDYVCRTVVNGIEINPAFAWQALFDRSKAYELTGGQEDHKPYEPIAHFIPNVEPQMGFEVDLWEHEETPRALHNGDDKGFAEADYALSLIPSADPGAIAIPPNSHTHFTRNIQSNKSNFDITYRVNWYIDRGAIYRENGGSLEMCDGELNKTLVASTPGLPPVFQQYYRWEIKENGNVYTYEQDANHHNEAPDGNHFNVTKHLDAVPVNAEIRTLEIKVASFTRHFNNAMLSNGYTDARIVHVHKTPAADPTIFTPEGARCFDSDASIFVNRVPGNKNYYDFAIKRLADGKTGGTQLYSGDEYPVSISPTAVFGDSEHFPPGDYEVAIIDRSPAGCATNTSVKTIITIPPRPARIQWAGSKTDETCTDKKDGVIVMGATGGVGDYKYYYQEHLVTDRLTALSPGDYFITIRDKNYRPDEEGCETTTTIPILTAPPFDLSNLKIEVTQVSCISASDGIITINTGNTDAYQYRLRDADGQTVRDWQTTNTFAQLPFGTGLYKADIRNQNSCEYSQNVPLQSPPPLKAEITVKQQVTCHGYNDGTIEITGVGGATGQYRFSIDNGPFTEYMKTSETISGLEGGKTYSVRVQDINTCTSAATSVSLVQPQPVQAASTTTPDHCGQPDDGSISVTLQGGTIPYFYVLAETEQPREVIPTNGNHMVLLENLSEGNYTIKVRDAKGCTNTTRDPWLEINAHVNQESGVDAFYRDGDIVGASCNGPSEGQVTIRARDGQPPYSFSDNGVDFVQSAGNDYYTFTHVPVGGPITFYVKDANHCAGTIQITIPQDNVQLEILEKVDADCKGTQTGKLVLQGKGGTPPYEYASNDRTYSANNIFTNLPPDTYTLYVKDSKGCVATTTTSINTPTLDLGGPMFICHGQTITLDPGLPGNYLWTSTNGFNSTAHSVSLQEPGEYTVTITNPEGCNFTDTFIIVVAQNLLQADLLMADSATVGQEVIGIDLTLPEPEERKWIFEESKIQHSVEAQFYNRFVFSEPGVYTIELRVNLASCEDSFIHTITILDENKKDDDPSGRENASTETVIRDFSAYPNPTNGKFNAKVVLSQKQDIQLSLMDAVTGKAHYVTDGVGKDEYNIAIECPPLAPGLYFLKLTTQNQDHKIMQIMIVR